MIYGFNIRFKNFAVPVCFLITSVSSVRQILCVCKNVEVKASNRILMRDLERRAFRNR